MPVQKNSLWQKISKVGIMLIFAAAFLLFFLYGKIFPENLADAPVTLFIFVFLSLVMLVANMA